MKQSYRLMILWKKAQLSGPQISLLHTEPIRL